VSVSYHSLKLELSLCAEAMSRKLHFPSTPQIWFGALLKMFMIEQGHVVVAVEEMEDWWLQDVLRLLLDLMLEEVLEFLQLLTE